MKDSSLEKLYNMYSYELYLYALSLCKNHHLAQDLVSDTFYKALLSLEKRNIEIKYWLFRVCKNTWIDNLKKKRYDLFSLNDVDIVDKGDILDDLIASEGNKDMYKHILSLSPTYREVIILFYFCGLPLKIIGENMGISPGAVRTLIFRARQKLKTVLEEDGSWDLLNY